MYSIATLFYLITSITIAFTAFRLTQGSTLFQFTVSQVPNSLIKCTAVSIIL